MDHSVISLKQGTKSEGTSKSPIIIETWDYSKSFMMIESSKTIRYLNQASRVNQNSTTNHVNIVNHNYGLQQRFL